MIEVPYSMPASAPKRPRAPHPSGYQLAKAKNKRMLDLINAIDAQVDAAPWSAQVEVIRGMISGWRNNG